MNFTDEKKNHKFGDFYKLVVLGVSTGGPKALLEIIPNFPEELRVPIIIALHMPQFFITDYSLLLAKKTKLCVKIAEDFEPLRAATIYLARGDYHLIVEHNSCGEPVLRLHDRERVNNCKPSVDLLFESVAKIYKESAIAVIMTGMGEDGARGIKIMKDNGAKTIAQDEDTSVVWGMAGAAVKAKAIDDIIPLNKIGTAILRYLEK